MNKVTDRDVVRARELAAATKQYNDEIERLKPHVKRDLIISLVLLAVVLIGVQFI
jgi:hypothetical protein